MPSRSARPLAVGAFLLLTCAVTCPDVAPRVVPNGSWGGEHIGIIVTDTGATVEYDCAAGTITEPLQLDTRGNFDWRGVHYPGHGGPVRIDEPPNAHPARYTGRATADHMTITLTILDLATSPQTFTLSRGGNSRVFKCL